MAHCIVPWTALRGEGGEVTSESVLEQPKKKGKGGGESKMKALSGYSSKLPQEIPFPLKL